MSSNKMLTLLAGLIFYLIFLVATAPATLFAGWLDHATGGQLLVSDARGSIWMGSGQLFGAGKSMGSMNWAIRAPELLLGRVHVLVRNGDAPPMDIVMSPSGTELKHVYVTVPASLLGKLAKPLELMQPGGEMIVKSADFSLSGKPRGEIDIDWLNAHSVLTTVNPLGAYHIRIDGAGSGLGIRLDTREGPLFLQGSGAWAGNAGLHFDGTATSKNEQLSALLRLIGKPGGNGSYSLHIDSNRERTAR